MENNMRRIQAFLIGVKDGLDQPYELTMGITWVGNFALNNWYDRGVNLGQRIGKRLQK